MIANHGPAWRRAFYPTAGRPVALGALAVGGVGCLMFMDDDPLVYQALDYRIDRPRVLAIAVDPPMLRSGREVVLDALALAPGGLSATDGTWKTCGLSESAPAQVYGLDCFGAGEGVEELAEGIPARWTPPDRSGADCEEGDTWYGGCSYELPFLLEARLGDDVVRGMFYGSLPAGEPVDPDEPVAASWRDMPLELSLQDDGDGVVAAEAWLGMELAWAAFRWYVDDGTLLFTGRTAAQGRRDGGTWSRNRWVVPEGAGSWRVAVVVSSEDAWEARDTGPWETGGWDDTGTWPGVPAWPEVADMTWAVAAWEAR